MPGARRGCPRTDRTARRSSRTRAVITHAGGRQRRAIAAESTVAPGVTGGLPASAGCKGKGARADEQPVAPRGAVHSAQRPRAAREKRGYFALLGRPKTVQNSAALKSLQTFKFRQRSAGRDGLDSICGGAWGPATCRRKFLHHKCLGGGDRRAGYFSAGGTCGDKRRGRLQIEDWGLGIGDWGLDSSRGRKRLPNAIV